MKIIATIILCATFSLNATAALVSGTVTGAVTSSNPGNAFGLGVGDPIQLTVTFDDGVLTGVGGEAVFFNSATGNTMELTVGVLSFTEAMDTAGGLGPQLAFFDGELSEITYTTEFGASGIFFSFIEFFEGSDSAGNAVNGGWDLASFSETVVPIPIPFALGLFSGALCVLGRVARMAPR